MEMTIEKIKNNTAELGMYARTQGWDSEYSDSVNEAINIIEKYQKIEKILSDWIDDNSVGMSDYWMGRIKEVIEDGNE